MKANTLAPLLILLVAIGCQADPQTAADLLIENVTVIDGTGAPARAQMDVGVMNGRIVSVNPSPSRVVAQDTVDGTGKFLIPGLIDGHAHPFPIESNMPIFIRFGVTSIFVPGCSVCTNEAMTRAREMAQDSAVGAVAAPTVYHTSQHFTMEGRHPVKTYPNGNWVEGETVYYVRDTLHIASLVEEVVGHSNIGIKVTIEDGPEPPFVERIPMEFVRKIVTEAHKHGLEVFAHVDDIEEVRIASAAGVDHIIHFVGVDVDFDRDKEVLQELFDRDVSWVTTLMIDKSFFYPSHPEWLESVRGLAVFDSNELDRLASSSSESESLALLSEIYGIENPTMSAVLDPQLEDLRGLHNFGIDLVIGTDTGNDFIFPGLSMHEEMEMMTSGGHFAPIDVIKMATHNSAKMLGVLSEVGTIEAGKVADMILLDKSPLDDIRNTRSINTVFSRGVPNAVSN